MDGTLPESVVQHDTCESIVPLIDAVSFDRYKVRYQPVEHVFSNKQPVTSPQKQKPQRERRGFYKFSGGPGRSRTRAEDA